MNLILSGFHETTLAVQEAFKRCFPGERIPFGIQPQAHKFMKSSDTNKISFTEIHQALPQIQCGRCDTPGCKEYAESIVEGAPINRCIPGGNETLKKLQTITGNIDQTLDHSYGRQLSLKLP